VVTQYNVSALREQERFAYWHDLICRLFPRAAGRRGDELPFVAHLDQSVLGTIEVSDISCNALRYDRARQDQRQDDNEDFLLSLMLQGSAQLEQDGRIAVQGPGDIVLYDAARPFIYDFPQAYRILLAKIPRRAMLGRLPDAERMTAVTVESHSTLGGLAANMMRTAASLNLPGEAPASARVGASLVDILSAAIELELSGRKELCNRQAALLKRAKEHMRARLDETELDVDRIANALHVSPRTLSRAFASEGTTVIRWLWSARLEASYTALKEGCATQVTDVALGCGFTSGSHFSRMFKSTYGVLPHTLLRGTERID
jgi:AraC family transcriptional activator of tynA and feaB